MPKLKRPGHVQLFDWRPQPLMLLILLLAFGLRLYRLGAQGLTWDELSTVARATIPLEGMFENLFIVRNHVPLYFLLMRLWTAIGREEFILRFFSLIFGLLAVALIYWVGRLIGSRKVGLVAAFLLAISPFHIWYSQETRMYSLVMAAVLAASGCLIHLLARDNRRDWIGYTISMLAALYTHYLAALILIVHYAFFSLHYRRIRSLFGRWLIFGGLAGGFFALWLLVMFATGGFKESPIGWIAAAHWYEPFLTLLSLSAGPSIDPGRSIAVITPLIFTAAAAVCFFQVNHRLRIDETADRQRPVLVVRLLLLWLVLPILLVTLISLDLPIPQKRAIYMDRYLIISLPALLLLAAWGLILAARSRRLVLPLALLLIVLSIAPTLVNMAGDPMYGREAWRAALSQIKDTRQPGDILLTRSGQELPLFYYGDGQIEIVNLSLIDDQAPGELAPLQAGRILAEAAPQARRAWLITSRDNANPHGFPQERNRSISRSGPLDSGERWLAESGDLLKQWTYPGIRLSLYELPRPVDNGQS